MMKARTLLFCLLPSLLCLADNPGAPQSASSATAPTAGVGSAAAAAAGDLGPVIGDAPPVVTISEGGELTLHDIDSMARPIYQPAPKWPPSQPIAQYDKDPVVVLKFVVKHDGTTARFEVESATAEAFAEAAIAAVQDWRFEPATKDGAPVSVAVLQPIVFPIPLFSPSLKADSSERRVMMRDMPERRSVDGVRGAEIKRDLLESTPFARFVKDKAKADSRFWRVELPGKAGLYHWEGVKITTRGGRMTDYQLNPVARLRAPE